MEGKKRKTEAEIRIEKEEAVALQARIDVDRLEKKLRAAQIQCTLIQTPNHIFIELGNFYEEIVLDTVLETLDRYPIDTPCTVCSRTNRRVIQIVSFEKIFGGAQDL